MTQIRLLLLNLWSSFLVPPRRPFSTSPTLTIPSSPLSTVTLHFDQDHSCTGVPSHFLLPLLLHSPVTTPSLVSLLVLYIFYLWTSHSSLSCYSEFVCLPVPVRDCFCSLGGGSRCRGYCRRCLAGVCPTPTSTLCPGRMERSPVPNSFLIFYLLIEACLVCNLCSSPLLRI